MLLERLTEQAKKDKLNIYNIAEMTKEVTRAIHLQPANSCNNSYSVAKVFTVTAIGMLQDDGILNVKDHLFPIFKDAFPPVYDKKWEKVTIEDAIKHRVGFDKGFLDIDAENIYEYGADDFLQIVLSHSLSFEPGTQRVYSDAAYYLLSRIVTAKTGRKLDDFLLERLFNPLEFQEIAWSKCPKGYPMGATGLYIRTEDMVKLGFVYLSGGMYRGKRIVSEAWVDQVLRCGYELRHFGNGNSYGKRGMNGQMLYISFDSKTAVAWHGYNRDGVDSMLELLKKD
ncbi:MAG: serine hydrolase [Bacillota bacterium]|nr:serine hydrolase [Bacillota bacterium]